MSSPFLSIVTISFNQARFLRETIESVLSQKGDDVEYIVVDPGSTDGSREIIAEYRDRIDHVVLDPDAGPADGLNKGFAVARGRIGYFLNSDDYLLPGAIDKLRRLWSEHPQAKFLLCRAWLVDENGAPIRELVPTPIRATDLRLGAATIVQQGVSFELDLFREVGGFNVANRSCWDYELLAEFARRKARFATSSERIAAFRIYGDSITGGGAGQAHEERFDRDFDRIHRSILDQPGVEKRMTVLRRGRWLKMIANPTHAVHRLRELTLPATIRTRWGRDS
jgi:glycosyltransferase involved in cell wall biosynthesis